jgi:HIV Tat-specific factor 1
LQTPAAPILAREKRKRKDEYDPSQPATIKRGKGAAASSSSSSSSTKLPKPPKNTAVYVTNLPLDTEADELHARFAKCGLIEEDDDGSPKIKMYASEDGSFNGQALVVFFKEDSVTLAVNLMDDAELRLGDMNTKMRVQKAEFSHKNTGGDGQPSAPRKTVDKKKISKRLGKMQRCVLKFIHDTLFFLTFIYTKGN